MPDSEKVCDKKMFNIFRSFVEIKILWHLKQKSMHGYKLFEELTKHHNSMPHNHPRLQPSRIYPFLKALSKRKLISATLKSDGARQRKEYAITSHGVKHLDEFRKKIPLDMKKFLRYMSG